MKKSAHKNKDILLVTEYFAPHWTGISQSCYYIAKSLIKQGYNVHVLTTQYDLELPLHEVRDGIEIERVPYQIRLSRTHYSWKIVLRFISSIRNFDCVIINSPNSNILFLAILAKIFGKRLVIYHQGDLVMPKQTGSFLAHKIVELFFDALTIPAMFLADRISTFTEDYAQNSRVMKYFLYKFFPYIPALVISQKKPDTVFKAKLDTLKSKHILIGFAGRFVEEKGFDVLLEAIPLVSKKYPQSLFVFAGKTDIDYEPFFEKLKPMIEKNKNYLNFMGLLNENNLAYFYKNLHCFVLSSRSECLALTQLEALLQKVPVVVSNIPGARMPVKETGYGVVVEPESPQSLSDGIIKILNSKETLLKKYPNVDLFFKRYAVFHID